MITRIQCRHYRSLFSVDQPLRPFQALVGPNACGKSTFLDVLVLLSDILKLRGDVREAVAMRSPDFRKLVWKGRGVAFQIAVEARIPDSLLAGLGEARKSYSVLRYEIEIGLDEERNEIGLNHENLSYLRPGRDTDVVVRDDFPREHAETGDIFTRPKSGKQREREISAVIKKRDGNDTFHPDVESKFKPSFRLGRTRSALANIPSDADRFPVSLWFQQLLERGVQHVILDSQVIKQPSPPGLGRRFKTDGSNLPWVIEELGRSPRVFGRWIDHVRSALEDVKSIKTIVREEDRHRYLVVEYDNGAEVPSWLVSDGTLRLLALTIPAYLNDAQGMYLIEEPENGIHPRAVETVVQSLTSVYKGQVMIATHSPVVINHLEPQQILCFAKDEAGATDIVSGEDHPRLREWKDGSPSFSDLFASGILS